MVLNQRQTKLIKRIIKHYGHTTQFNKCVEELSELIRALVRDDRNNLIEEIADVYIMLDQLMMMCNIPKHVIDQVIDNKIDRTLERIEKEKQHDKKCDHKFVIMCKFDNTNTAK